MLELRATIVGLDRLIHTITYLPDRLEGEMETAIREGLGLITGELAMYPAAIPGSRYVRTGLLGQRWASATRQVQRLGYHRLEGRMTNTRPGVTYVQSGEDQPAVHRGRWKTAEQVIEEKQGQIETLLGIGGERAVGG